MFALSRTGMERSHIQSSEIEDLIGKVNINDEKITNNDNAFREAFCISLFSNRRSYGL